MDENATRKVIRLRFRRMKKNYLRIAHNYDQEAIHHFRVEYKKLRAFLRMMSGDPAYAKMKIPGHLRDIYQKAGTVRDLQLHTEIMATHAASLGVQAIHVGRSKRKLTAAKQELDKTMQPGVLALSQEKIEKKIRGGVEDSIVGDFVLSKMSEIQGIMAHKIIRDTHLHSVRKCLKDVIYIAIIFKKDLSLPLPVKGWNDEREKYLASLASELGSFQDNCISLAHLKEDQQSASPGTDKKLIAGLYRKHCRLKDQQKLSLKKQCADTNHFRL